MTAARAGEAAFIFRRDGRRLGKLCFAGNDVGRVERELGGVDVVGRGWIVALVFDRGGAAESARGVPNVLPQSVIRSAPSGAAGALASMLPLARHPAEVQR